MITVLIHTHSAMAFASIRTDLQGLREYEAAGRPVLTQIRRNAENSQ